MKVIVFDDLLIRRQSDYLTPGLELVFYENADDAVAVVEFEVPALVLMDYSMSARLTGADAVRVLRQRFSLSELKIVGISSDSHSNSEMLRAGADDALPKSHLRGYLARLVGNRGQ